MAELVKTHLRTLLIEAPAEVFEDWLEQTAAAVRGAQWRLAGGVSVICDGRVTRGFHHEDLTGKLPSQL